MDSPPIVCHVAERFIAAIAAGDGQAAASLMTDAARHELLSAVRGRRFAVTDAREAAARVWSGRWIGRLKEVRVDEVHVERARATVNYSHARYGRDADDTFMLARVDGRWLVDSLPWTDDPDAEPSWAAEP